MVKINVWAITITQKFDHMLTSSILS